MSLTIQSPLFKEFVRYLFFSCLSMLAVSCYILADTFFIARFVGETGLAALNLTVPTYFAFISGPGMLLGIGGASFFSIYLGKRHFRTARNYFHTTLTLGVLYGTIFTALVIPNATSISRLLGADPITLPHVRIYLIIMVAFTLPFVLDHILLIFMRNDNAPTLAMVAMILSNVVNVTLDWVFMGPMAMGMAGAALATGFSPLTGLTVMAFHFLKEERELSFTDFKVQFAKVKDIVPTGLPAYALETASGIVIFVFNWLLLGLGGNLAVSAYSIISNTSLVVFALFTGIGQGLQPLVSYAFGAGRYNDLWKLWRWGIITAIGFGTLVFIGGQICTDGIIALFNRDGNPALAKMAGHGFRLFIFAFIIKGANVVAVNFFSAVAAKQPSLVISLAAGFFFPLSFAFLLSTFFGLSGVWITLFISELVTFFFVPFLFTRFKYQNHCRINPSLMT